MQFLTLKALNLESKMLAALFLLSVWLAIPVTAQVVQQHDSIIHDTVWVRHDTVYAIDTTYARQEATYYDFYDYYCGGAYWDSLDCRGYLLRPTIWYVPRLRRVPTRYDRHPYLLPPRGPGIYPPSPHAPPRPIIVQRPRPAAPPSNHVVPKKP